MSLTDIALLLARQWRLILGFVITGALIAAVFLLTANETFESTASVYVETAVPDSATRAALQQSVAYTNYRTITLERLATSDLVLDRVANTVDPATTSEQLRSRVTALSALDTSIIDIRVLDEDPARAAAIANEIADELARSFSIPATSEGDIAVEVKLSNRAEPASAPSTPRPELILGFAGFSALLGGAALALALHALNPRLWNADDVRGVRRLPLIGILPTAPLAADRTVLDEAIRRALGSSDAEVVTVSERTGDAATLITERLRDVGVDAGGPRNGLGDRRPLLDSRSPAVIVIGRGERAARLATTLETVESAGVEIAGYVLVDVPRRGVDAFARTRGS